MEGAGWAGLLTAIHDTLFACDRETRFALAGTDRRLWLTVRADTVTAEIPAYDPAMLTELGWRAPRVGQGVWSYEAPRTVEHVDWLCRFAVYSASLMITSDPGTLTFHESDPAADPTPAPVLTVVPDPGSSPVLTRDPAASAPAPTPVLAVAPDPAPTPDPALAPDLALAPGPALAPEPVVAPEPALSIVPEWQPEPEPEWAWESEAEATAALPVMRAADPVPPAPLTVVPEPEAAPRTPEEALAALRAVLTGAVAERDLTGYVAALRGAAVSMPLLDDPSPETGVRPAVVRGADNAIFLPIFTSPDGLADFAGTGVPFLTLAFGDLLDDWPEPDWGMIVDPRTEWTLTLTADTLAGLRVTTFPTAAAG
ncbi:MULTISPECIES: SseB family protein [Catenuloplanes]|uniref:SseB protein N-terminal domain-containing protein n=1 Tax=Catenuloplanes niger TaxID=587534 RepID=A0AAE3ZL94_9ACTN|nr:SseB family protein [Catenuloplanes niger]MDR7321993.1 hypothetical protein [Catenuloplanes niger]